MRHRWYMYVRGNPLAYWDPFGLRKWYDRLLFAAADLGAGIADNITFGVTSAVRDAIGIGDAVDKESTAYKVGDHGATVVQLAAAAPVGATKAALRKGSAEGLARRAGRETVKHTDEAAAAARQRMAQNADAGRAREAATTKDLQNANPNASVQNQPTLRNADGSRAIDPQTGTGRRVDHAVVEDGKVTQLVETTSETADEAQQIAKQERIMNEGEVFIRDRQTGDRLRVNDAAQEVCRPP